MTANQAITPTSEITDAAGRDWAWAFVIFRAVAGYPGYSVGSNGSVWSRWDTRHRLGPWRMLKGTAHRQGYRCFRLQCEGKYRMWFGHRLVAFAFLGEPAEGQEVCHNNGNPEDNRVGNLRWDSRSENAKDGIRHGTVVVPMIVGSRHKKSKLAESDIPEIRRRRDAGQTFRGIASDFGVCDSTIIRIVKGRKWRHVV
jgi:hypothetical protein